MARKGFGVIVCPFSSFLGLFPPISGHEPFSIFFRLIFPIFGFRPVFHSIPGRLTAKRLAPAQKNRRVSRFLRCFKKGNKETLAVQSYLVLQACISVLRCFRQEWCISVFALFAPKTALLKCWRILPGCSWRIFLGTFFPTRMGRKDLQKNPALKNEDPRKIRSAKNRAQSMGNFVF